MIAMAIALDPAVLIADEPTTALDVTVQAQIMALLQELQEERQMGLILITHDLGVVADVADKIAVMYAGRIVERADVYDLYRQPAHPYTKGLLESIPRLDQKGQTLTAIGGLPPNLTRSRRAARSTRAARTPRTSAPRTAPSCARSPAVRPHATSPRRSSMAEAILTATDLVKYYPIKGGVLRRTVGQVKAVDGVSFELYKGETLGIVGESGCGKSTLGRLLMRLEEPTSGSVVFDGVDMFKQRGKAMRKLRRDIQIVFQDPYTSLNPRKTVGDIVEAFDIHPDVVPKQGRRRAVQDLLDKVGLNLSTSTGTRTSSPAASASASASPGASRSTRGADLRRAGLRARRVGAGAGRQPDGEAAGRLGLSYIFIAHDLSVVRHISDRVGVMYLGKMAELGDEDQVYSRPTHPYTQALLSAVPVPDPTLREKREQIVLKGDVPSPANPPSGCRFHRGASRPRTSARWTCRAHPAAGRSRPAPLGLPLRRAARRSSRPSTSRRSTRRPAAGPPRPQPSGLPRSPADRHTSVSVPPSPLWGGRHGALWAGGAPLHRGQRPPRTVRYAAGLPWRAAHRP